MTLTHYAERSHRVKDVDYGAACGTSPRATVKNVKSGIIIENVVVQSYPSAFIFSFPGICLVDGSVADKLIAVRDA
jgi:hypothetical protein